MNELDLHIRQFSRDQFGLMTVAQLRAVGATRKAVRHRVARGDLVVLSPRLLRSTSVEVTAQQQALAGVLDAGTEARLSDDSAAYHWGIPGYDLLPAWVCRPRVADRSQVSLAHVRELTSLPAELVTTYRGIPVVTPSLLLLQLAATKHPLRVERAMDTALAMGLCNPASLQRALELMARSGRNGIVEFRRMVARRDASYRPPESGQESRLQWILDRAGERPLRRQVDVGGSRWLARADFVDDIDPFILQVQSERYHSALTDREHDRRQTEALEAAGYVIRHVWDTELWHKPDVVLARVREGRRLARRRRLDRPEAS